MRSVRRGTALGGALSIMLLTLIIVLGVAVQYMTYIRLHKAIQQEAQQLNKPHIKVSGVDFLDMSHIRVQLYNEGPGPATIYRVGIYRYDAYGFPSEINWATLNRTLPVGGSATVEFTVDGVYRYVSSTHPLRVLIETDKGPEPVSYTPENATITVAVSAPEWLSGASADMVKAAMKELVFKLNTTINSAEKQFSYITGVCGVNYTEWGVPPVYVRACFDEEHNTYIFKLSSIPGVKAYATVFGNLYGPMVYQDINKKGLPPGFKFDKQSVKYPVPLQFREGEKYTVTINPPPLLYENSRYSVGKPPFYVLDFEDLVTGKLVDSGLIDNSNVGVPGGVYYGVGNFDMEETRNHWNTTAKKILTFSGHIVSSLAIQVESPASCPATYPQPLSYAEVHPAPAYPLESYGFAMELIAYTVVAPHSDASYTDFKSDVDFKTDYPVTPGIPIFAAGFPKDCTNLGSIASPTQPVLRVTVPVNLTEKGMHMILVSFTQAFSEVSDYIDRIDEHTTGQVVVKAVANDTVLAQVYDEWGQVNGKGGLSHQFNIPLWVNATGPMQVDIVVEVWASGDPNYIGNLTSAVGIFLNKILVVRAQSPKSTCMYRDYEHPGFPFEHISLDGGDVERYSYISAPFTIADNGTDYRIEYANTLTMNYTQDLSSLLVWEGGNLILAYAPEPPLLPVAKNLSLEVLPALGNARYSGYRLEWGYQELGFPLKLVAYYLDSNPSNNPNPTESVTVRIKIGVQDTLFSGHDADLLVVVPINVYPVGADSWVKPPRYYILTPTYATGNNLSSGLLVLSTKDDGETVLYISTGVPEPTNTGSQQAVVLEFGPIAVVADTTWYASSLANVPPPERVGIVFTYPGNGGPYNIIVMTEGGNPVATEATNITDYYVLPLSKLSNALGHLWWTYEYTDLVVVVTGNCTPQSNTYPITAPPVTPRTGSPTPASAQPTPRPVAPSTGQNSTGQTTPLLVYNLPEDVASGWVAFRATGTLPDTVNVTLNGVLPLKYFTVETGDGTLLYAYIDGMVPAGSKIVVLPGEGERVAPTWAFYTDTAIGVQTRVYTVEGTVAGVEPTVYGFKMVAGPPGTHTVEAPVFTYPIAEAFKLEVPGEGKLILLVYTTSGVYNVTFTTYNSTGPEVVVEGGNTTMTLEAGEAHTLLITSGPQEYADAVARVDGYILKVVVIPLEGSGEVRVYAYTPAPPVRG